jgi:hypothetical protein
MFNAYAHIFSAAARVVSDLIPAEVVYNGLVGHRRA